MSTGRRENETLDEYRKRRTTKTFETKKMLGGRKVEVKNSVFSREMHRNVLRRAKKELARARARGYSDNEILEALRSGDEAMKMYADYIDFL